MDARQWHAHNAEDVIEWLGTDSSRGLSEDEVTRLKKVFGPNYFEKKIRLTLFRKVMRYLGSPLTLILILALLSTLFLGKNTDAVVIILAILINIGVGLYQEGRTDRAFERLSSSQERSALVVRNGGTRRVSTRELVPGDIVLLGAGEITPADIRLLSVRDLFLNESALTGESAPVEKDIAPSLSDAPITEQKNMVWMGTAVVSGTGRGAVVTTGTQTKIGQIAAQLLATHDTETPIQRNIARLARFLALVVSVVVVGIFVLGVARGEDIAVMLLLAVAVAVSAVPEGLPAAVAVSLAVGVERLLDRGGLVRTIVTAETLGSTTFILTDKTGTLTRAEMTLKSAYVPGVGSVADGDTARDALALGAFASDVFFENSGKDETRVNGRPMEKIMVESALRLGLSKDFDTTHPIVGALPFNSKYKFGAYVREDRETDKRRMYVAGAPELVLAASTSYGCTDKSRFSAEEKQKTENVFEIESAHGHRILAVAWKDVPKGFDTNTLSEETVLEGLSFGALLLFEDPLRFDARESVLAAQEAGASVRMLTGDNPAVARTIAREVGISSDGVVVTGQDIEEMSDEELLSSLRQHAVFARVLPLQKMRMAKVLKDAGEVVAMTGDGINDAPALKAADIGVALGSGTEVAKEASDLVLIHDSFSIIVAAIEEGRRIMDNLKKMTTHLLATSFGEIMIIIGAIIGGLALPILPVQILWLNIVQEGFLSFAFAFEPAEPGILKRNPRSDSVKKLLTKEVRQGILGSGIVTGVLVFVVYLFLSRTALPLPYIQTLMFGALSLSALTFAFSLKNFTVPIWRISLFSNMYLVWAVLISLVLLVVAFIVAPLRNLLSLVPIDGFGVLTLLVLAFFNLCIIEATKFFVFKAR
ncbi:MAG: putative cation-transporting ATPase F [Candidatus Campbellbacteria bacterium]